MNFGNAKREDVPALRRLWMTCFGDPEAYVDRHFAHSFDPGRVFVLRKQTVRAMLITFPVKYIAADGDEQAGFYLYAVCTAPADRGRGLCRTLMQKTEQALKDEGAAFTCLRAADAGLSAMYARMGYAATFFNKERVFHAGTGRACPQNTEPLHPGAPAWQSVSPLEYYGLRQLALQGGFLDYPPEVLAHQARLGPLFSIDGGAAFGAMERYGDEVILKEYFGGENYLPALADSLGVETLIVRTPGDTPFAMAKALTDLPAPTGYLGLAFD